MTERNNSNGFVRLVIELSPEFYQHLEVLQQRVDVEDKAHLIREALRLYDYVVDRHLEGGEFFVRTPDGREDRLALLETSASLS